MMRVIEHTVKGFLWESTVADRKVRGVYLKPSTASVNAGGTKITLLEGRDDRPRGEWKGPHACAQAIATTWLHGLSPGSNRITWTKKK